MYIYTLYSIHCFLLDFFLFLPPLSIITTTLDVELSRPLCLSPLWGVLLKKKYFSWPRAGGPAERASRLHF